MFTEQPEVNLIVPLYNEEDVYDELIVRLTKVIENTELTADVIMVDDGSTDQTAELMRETSKKDGRFTSVFLSRNFGHQLALSAGLSHATAADAVFVLDGDLQDPPELLDKFYSYLQRGYDVVYAVRKKRKEGWLKKLAYKSYYALLKRMSNFDIPIDSGDFSLISRRVVDYLNRMDEESRFIRGMRSWIGFKQIGVPYEREERHSGESKYTLSRLLKLAFNGIFNFSELPIKFITTLGILTVLTSTFYLAITLFQRLIYDVVPEGFTALLLTIILFGGVQLISIGILGEYILRIFFEVKKRPLFIVKSKIQNQKKVNG